MRSIYRRWSLGGEENLKPQQLRMLKRKVAWCRSNLCRAGKYPLLADTPHAHSGGVVHGLNQHVAGSSPYKWPGVVGAASQLDHLCRDPVLTAEKWVMWRTFAHYCKDLLKLGSDESLFARAMTISAILLNIIILLIVHSWSCFMLCNALQLVVMLLYTLYMLTLILWLCLMHSWVVTIVMFNLLLCVVVAISCWLLVWWIYLAIHR